MKAALNMAMISDLHRQTEQEEMEAKPNEQVLTMFQQMARAYAESIVKNGRTKTQRKKAG